MYYITFPVFVSRMYLESTGEEHKVRQTPVEDS